MAVQGLMIPSLWEIRTYCTSDEHSRCPLYQRYAANHEKVSPEVAAVLLDSGASNPARGGAARHRGSPDPAQSTRAMGGNAR
jgi:hypothetical protein